MLPQLYIWKREKKSPLLKHLFWQYSWVSWERLFSCIPWIILLPCNLPSRRFNLYFISILICHKLFCRLSFENAKYTWQDKEHVLLHILKIDTKWQLFLLCLVEAGEGKSVMHILQTVKMKYRLERRSLWCCV